MEATYRITPEHRRTHEGDTRETLAAGTSVCRLEARGVCFIQLRLRSSSPAAQSQGKVLVRLSAGLLWRGPGLNHYITKGKSRLWQEKVGLP